MPFLLFPSLMTRFQYLSEGGKDIRLGVCLMYLEIVKSNPVMGIGFGMQTYIDDRLDLAKYNERVNSRYRQTPPIATPHNTLFDIAARLGIVGLGIYLWILFKAARTNLKLISAGGSLLIKKRGCMLFAAFIAFVIQAQLHDTTYGIQAIVQYTIFGMIAILWRLNRKIQDGAGF